MRKPASRAGFQMTNTANAHLSLLSDGDNSGGQLCAFGIHASIVITLCGHVNTFPLRVSVQLENDKQAVYNV
ncbi:hypothetical protein MAIT1_05190 [Magnetofaba australis IT-1]|uniref:Uncharacterized protein n=1 Tax=Magnetofaba australis IT-1 TaxID=1434232 RepID=A0A1Y2K938_9PROT|nr:hypothetical protein MAIT1_05190 [Magnetofaba australis IT-1]